MIGWLPRHFNAAARRQARTDAAAVPVDGLTATPVHEAAYPDADRVRWQPYNGQPRGSDLIRMAPWFDDGLLDVDIARRYYWQDAAAAHREIEKGHTRGKLVLIVDEDLAATMEL